ncbi:hypothetical protein K8I61_15425 [bacterium]|nr:hypothetical protein [bacterium]
MRFPSGRRGLVALGYMACGAVAVLLLQQAFSPANARVGVETIVPAIDDRAPRALAFEAAATDSVPGADSIDTQPIAPPALPSELKEVGSDVVPAIRPLASSAPGWPAAAMEPRQAAARVMTASRECACCANRLQVKARVVADGSASGADLPFPATPTVALERDSGTVPVIEVEANVPFPVSPTALASELTK